MTMTATPADELERVHGRYREHTAFAELAARGNFVPGNGPLASPVMMIGEAPGAEEDRLGYPFAGRAGQLLDEMLAEAGLQRRLIRVDNVLPWRPPGNRTPYPFEILAAHPLVIEKIAVTRPEIVVTLGAVAWQAVTGKKMGPFAEHRGQWLHLQVQPPGLAFTVALLPLYHPSYILQAKGVKGAEARAETVAALRSILEGPAADG